jgi:hypothetical protein
MWHGHEAMCFTAQVLPRLMLCGGVAWFVKA